MNWIEIENIEQLNELEIISESVPVLIFKHSSRCGISRFALKSFENSFNFKADELKTYFLNLIQYREISNEIASKFNVIHQSPQVIVLKNKEVVYHDSHGSISVDAIKKALS